MEVPALAIFSREGTPARRWHLHLLRCPQPVPAGSPWLGPGPAQDAAVGTAGVELLAVGIAAVIAASRPSAAQEGKARIDQRLTCFF